MLLRPWAGAALLWLLAALPVASQSKLVSNTPHLERRGDTTQLIVDGRPFLALAGELYNNSATSLEYMKPVWPRLAAMHLNTVLVPVSWALLEPSEGKFDYSLVDGLIRDARAQNLRLVFLWFGSWKNTWSSYAPDWVKRDFERFSRVQLGNGSGTGRLSPLSEANRNPDARAFAALMRRIREVDSNAHTVIMMQVENEVGVIPDARDHSPAANAAYDRPVRVQELVCGVRPPWEPVVHTRGGRRCPRSRQRFLRCRAPQGIRLFAVRDRWNGKFRRRRQGTRPKL